MALFKKGISGNSAGRPKGSISKVDLFLSAKLDVAGLDWASIITTYINSLPLDKQYEEVMKLLPKLVVSPEMAPLEMQIASSTETSLDNAAKAFEAMKAAQEAQATKPKDKPKEAK